MAPRGRPRRVNDAAIVYATHRALGRLGFARLTLAAVAAEARLSPAALVKRFGSKGALLVAFYDLSTEMARVDMEQRLRASPPLDALESSYVDLAKHASDPIFVANSNSIYGESIGDPALRGSAQRRAEASDKQVRAILSAAVRRGELRRCDTKTISRVLRSALNGAFVVWAASGQGKAADWVHDCFDVVIGPLRKSPRNRR
jgi:AcrR family transcriptional regulator